MFGGKDYIDKCNISDDDLLIFSLCKKGYGTIIELNNLDTKELFDIVEYEQICNAIEEYETKRASR